MPQEILDNNFNDDEFNRFIKELFTSTHIEKLIIDARRDYFKASILKKNIKKWIAQKLIKEEESIGNLLDILNIEEEEIFQKNKKALIQSPPKNLQEKINEIRIIRQHLMWFIKEKQLDLNLSVHEFLKFLEILIEEKGQFLSSPPKPHKQE